MNQYYSTRQIAKILGLKTVTVRRWILRGKLPAVDLGREYRVDREDFEKFLRQRRVRGGK